MPSPKLKHQGPSNTPGYTSYRRPASDLKPTNLTASCQTWLEQPLTKDPWTPYSTGARPLNGYDKAAALINDPERKRKCLSASAIDLAYRDSAPVGEALWKVYQSPVRLAMLGVLVVLVSSEKRAVIQMKRLI